MNYRGLLAAILAVGALALASAGLSSARAANLLAAQPAMAHQSDNALGGCATCAPCAFECLHPCCALPVPPVEPSSHLDGRLPSYAVTVAFPAKARAGPEPPPPRVKREIAAHIQLGESI